MDYTNEIWKPIPNYIGYEASNLGRIRSIDRRLVYFNGDVYNKKGKILKPCIRNGYYFVHITAGCMEKVAILIAMTFKGYLNNDPNLIVDHIDEIKLNDREDNLQIITRRENISRSAKNKTGFTGVSKNYKKWQAIIRINGDQVRLGSFKTPEEASIAYQNKLKELNNS